MKNKIETIYADISNIGKKYGADKIVLFGSRARGDNRETSDIDIAVYGLPQEKQGVFWFDINELNTLLDFDIVFITERTNPKLLENIDRDGVILMNKFEDKLDKFQQACSRLQESLASYTNNPDDTMRDGVIQRFEFCVELAWKTLREKFIYDGNIELDSPRPVIKKAFADKLITDEEGWLDLLTDRNLTSHLYDAETAQEVFERIKGKYVDLFQALIEKLCD